MAMSRGRIEFYKEHYPRGTRVKLDGMGDDPCPVEPGAVGTVIAVDDIGTLHVEFDNGRSLGICPEVDGSTRSRNRSRLRNRKCRCKKSVRKFVKE